MGISVATLLGLLLLSYAHAQEDAGAPPLVSVRQFQTVKVLYKPGESVVFQVAWNASPDASGTI